MSTEAERITERRLALKMNKSELAREAGVHRDTIRDLEQGKGFQAATLAKVLDALTNLEEEAGLHAPPRTSDQASQGGVVRFTVQGVYGVDSLVVEGPVADIAELEAAVARIMRRVQGERPAAVPDPETPVTDQ